MFKKHYPAMLSILFLSVWIWSVWNPANLRNWLLENELTFLFVPIIVWVWRRLKISNLSLTCITLFIIFHIIGAHYNYGSVPFGNFVGNTFGILHTNEYDKFVHFSFGFLLLYPVLELLSHLMNTKIYIKSGIKKFWGYFLAFSIIMGASAFYEILEWLTVINVKPQIGYLYIGGSDPFDTQKDMAMAGIGALVAIMIYCIPWITTKMYYKKKAS